MKNSKNPKSLRQAEYKNIINFPNFNRSAPSHTRAATALHT